MRKKKMFVLIFLVGLVSVLLVSNVFGFLPISQLGGFLSGVLNGETSLVSPLSEGGEGYPETTSPITIAQIDPPLWDFTLEQEDNDLATNITIINDTVLELTVYAKHSLPGGYKWDMAVCNNSGFSSLQYMEEDSQGGFNYSYPENLEHIKLEYEGLNSSWCEETEGYGFPLFSAGSKQQLPAHFRLMFPNGTKMFEMFTGADTEVVIASSTDEGLGTGQESWNYRVFYDPNNDRWHVVYIDSGSDIHTASSADGTTWTDGADIDANTYDYDDFNCVLDVNGSNTYIHCAYATSTADSLYYRRAELTGTTPFITVGGEEKAFFSGDMDGNIADDAGHPAIVLDADRCVIIAFDLENDSASVAAEHGLTLLKEKSVCGNGDMDYNADLATGYPLYNQQVDPDDGYLYEFPIFIGLFPGETDAKLVWIDADSESTADLVAAYYNIATDSISAHDLMDTDIEWYADYASFASIISNEKSITFGMDDGTQDLDSFRHDTKEDITDIQADTGLNVPDSAELSGLVTAIVDVNATGGDDIWVFAVDNTDKQDIYYVNSTDEGTTWGTPTLWIDEAGGVEVKFLSSYFNEETCDVIVTWLSGSASPWNITVATINTGSCPAAAEVTEFVISIWDGNSWGANLSSNTTGNVTVNFPTGDIEFNISSNYDTNISSRAIGGSGFPDCTNSQIRICNSGTETITELSMILNSTLGCGGGTITMMAATTCTAIINSLNGSSPYTIDTSFEADECHQLWFNLSAVSCAAGTYYQELNTTGSS